MAGIPFSRQDEKHPAAPGEDGIVRGQEESYDVVEDDHDDLHREMKPRQLSLFTLLALRWHHHLILIYTADSTQIWQV